MGVKDPIAYYCEWMIGSIFDMKSFLFPYLLVVYKQEVLLAPFESWRETGRPDTDHLA